MTTKTCIKCNEAKELDEFYKNEAYKDGLQSPCKACKKAYRKAHYEANREQTREKVKAYAKSDKGKAVKAASKHKRRANKKNNGGTLTAKQIRELQANPNKTCFWCEADCNDKYDLDHIVPLSKGGRNSLRNIAISCQPCNNKKSDKDLSVWLKEINWYNL